MKHNLIKRIMLGVMGIAMLASCSEKPGPTPDDVVMKLREANRLYVTEYAVHKIITADDVKRLSGKIMNRQFTMKLPIGDRKIAIPMDAVIKAYVDFGELNATDVAMTTNPRKLTLTLPTPKAELTSSKIDNKGIREYTDILRSSFSDAEISEFESQGREAVLASIPEMDIEETAKANATALLKPMLMQLGYEADEIEIIYK